MSKASGKIIELISKPMGVRYRSPDVISPMETQLQYEDKSRSVQFQFATPLVEGDADSQAKRIKLRAIQSAKAMDYVEGDAFVYALMLVLKEEEKTQVSVEFSRLTERNLWDTALQFLLQVLSDNTSHISAQVTVQGFSRVKRIEMQEPRAGIVAAVKLDLANGKEELLEIATGQIESKELKNVITDFSKEKMILPSEIPSLYRLTKSLVHRAELEGITHKVIDDINALHLHSLLEEFGEDVTLADVHQCYETSQVKLAQLVSDIPQRIGQQGAGAFLTIQILKRNCHKMKDLNSTLLRLLEDELKQRSPRDRRSRHFAPGSI